MIIVIIYFYNLYSYIFMRSSWPRLLLWLHKFVGCWACRGGNGRKLKHEHSHLCQYMYYIIHICIIYVYMYYVYLCPFRRMSVVWGRFQWFQFGALNSDECEFALLVLWCLCWTVNLKKTVTVTAGGQWKRAVPRRQPGLSRQQQHVGLLRHRGGVRARRRQFEASATTEQGGGNFSLC